MGQAIKIGLLSTWLAGIAACSQVPLAAEQIESSVSPNYGERFKTYLINNDGARVGSVLAWQGATGVLMEIDAQSLPPGGLGLHLHSKGTCEDIDSFQESAGHVGSEEGAHGFLHPNGPHRGDLTNIYVSPEGRARVDVYSSLISLDQLSDSDGAALVVHESRDDYQTQPIGGAGRRIACAPFEPKAR